MTTKFDIAFDYVIQNEGTEFVDDPSDKGGATKFGISEEFIGSLNFEEKQSLPRLIQKDISNVYLTWPIKEYIKQLDIQPARMIYHKHFWLPIYDQIEKQDICNFIFDMTVQHGKKKSAELVERAINACHLGRILKIDGVFGKLCIECLNSFSVENDNYFRIKSSLIAVRESLFRCIVARDKSQAKFLDGWINRCYP